MTIYRGYGIAIIGIILGSALIANLLDNAFAGHTYWDTHGWPLAARRLLSTPSCYSPAGQTGATGLRLRGLPGAEAGAIMRRDSRELRSSREWKRGFYGAEG